MVISGILGYGSTGEVLNNYTIGFGIEVEPERHKFDFTKNLSWIKSQACITGYIINLGLNKTVVVVKLSISNDNRNIRSIIWNSKSWQTGVFSEIG